MLDGGPPGTAPATAVDVVVVEDALEPAGYRLRASLQGQVPAAPAGVYVLASPPAALPDGEWEAVDRGRLPGTAAWVLILRESDLLAAWAMRDLQSLVGRVPAGVDIVRLRLNPAAGAPAIATRLLVRRATGAAGPDGPRPGREVTYEVPEQLIVPLGLLAVAQAEDPSPGDHLRTRVPRSSLTWHEPDEGGVGEEPDAGWDLAALRRAAEDERRAWVLVAGAGWSSRLAARQAPRRVRLLIGAGAAAVALCHGEGRHPAWAKRRVLVGERLELVAVVCRRNDLQAALGRASTAGPLTPAEVVASVLALAAGSGSGCSYHLAGSRPELAEAPSEDTLAVVVAHAMVHPGPSATQLVGPGPRTAPVGEPPVLASGGGFAPRGVLPLELVFDARRRRLVLCTPLAPLPPDTFPQRVVIGGVDALAFPGTDAVGADDAGLRRGSPPREPRTIPFGTYHKPCGTWDEPSGMDRSGWSPTEEGGHQQGSWRLLGYFPRGALNDCASLFERVELGKALLRRRFAIDATALPSPAFEQDLMIYRMPGPDASEGDPVTEGSEVATTVVQPADTDRSPLVLVHPDALGVAQQAERPARPGPWIAGASGPCLRPLRNAVGVVGFARVEPRWGDATETDAVGPWSGLAPAEDRLALLRWNSDRGPRYTTGGRPLTATGAPDPSARFVHTVGWVRPAPNHGVLAAGDGVVPLVEWYHPGRRIWSYGTDPDEKLVAGFRPVTVLAGLDHHRGPAHLPLFRSRARRGSTRLHLVPGEALRSRVEQVAGFVVAAWPGHSSSAPTGPRSTTGAEPAPIHRAPWPGSWPLFELHRPGEEPCRSTAPAPLLRGGWAIAAVVGYVAARGRPDPEIAWLRAELGLDPRDAPRRSEQLTDVLHGLADIADGFRDGTGRTLRWAQRRGAGR